MIHLYKCMPINVHEADSAWCSFKCMTMDQLGQFAISCLKTQTKQIASQDRRSGSQNFFIRKHVNYIHQVSADEANDKKRKHRKQNEITARFKCSLMMQSNCLHT